MYRAARTSGREPVVATVVAKIIPSGFERNSFLFYVSSATRHFHREHFARGTSTEAGLPQVRKLDFRSITEAGLPPMLLGVLIVGFGRGAAQENSRGGALSRARRRPFGHTKPETGKNREGKVSPKIRRLFGRKCSGRDAPGYRGIPSPDLQPKFAQIRCRRRNCKSGSPAFSVAGFHEEFPGGP
jgi:hypothetical protein